MMIGEAVGKVALAVLGGVVIVVGLMLAAVVMLVCGRVIPSRRVSRVNEESKP